MSGKNSKNLDQNSAATAIETDENELLTRRDFMVGLKKWSKVVIGGAIGAVALGQIENASAGWINRRGGGGSWGNGGGGWGNHGGGSWTNGSGGGWANRRGGIGGWINRY